MCAPPPQPRRTTSPAHGFVDSDVLTRGERHHDDDDDDEPTDETLKPIEPLNFMSQ